MEKIWKQFESISSKLWSIDDSLLPIFIALNKIQTELIALSSKSRPVTYQPDILLGIRERLTDLESKYYKEGRFISKVFIYVYSKGEIPHGQAIVSSLMYNCYKLLRKISEQEENSLFFYINHYKQFLHCCCLSS